MTKIVAFGAFVQILPGVEGLVHISELAQHHVESPAEVVRPGDELKVKILEVDDSRRRLSLSVKRVEGQELPTRELSDDVVIEDAEPPEDVAPAPEEEEAAPGRRRSPADETAAGSRERAPADEAPEAPSVGGRPRGALRRSPPRGDPSRGAPGRGGARRGAPSERGLTRFLGLTGGIGAGKSEALAAFERAGAATLSTDRVAHDLLDDEEVRDALIERWGEELAPERSVDRDKVGEIVFNDRERARLAGERHPSARRGARAGLAPEPGAATSTSRSWRCRSSSRRRWRTPSTRPWPWSPKTSCETHACASGVRRAWQGREERQLDQAEKERRADHVIRNDASLEELDREVNDLMEKLRKGGGG